MEEMSPAGAAHKLRTGSDCEPLLSLYELYGPEFLEKCPEINGMYGLVIVDEDTDSFLVARDHVGIITLYYGFGDDGAFWVASEMKCLVEDCVTFQVFPPGHYYCSKKKAFVPFCCTRSHSVEVSSSFFLDPRRVLQLTSIIYGRPFIALLIAPLIALLIAPPISLAGCSSHIPSLHPLLPRR